MYKKNIVKKSSLKYLYIVVALLAIIPATIYILETRGITNFFYEVEQLNKSATSSEVSAEVPSAAPINTVDYGAPKPEDSTLIPDKNPNSLTPTPVNAELDITITSTRKNSAVTAYLVKAVVVGTDSGSCTVTMSKGQKSFTASSGISLVEGQYSCTDLQIPLSSLDEAGTWAVGVAVTDKSGATASTSTEVIL